MVLRLPADDSLSIQLICAIREGNLIELGALLKEAPDLARATLFEKANACGSMESTGRSLLHIATDWPGNFPNSAQTIHLLVDHGADVNARFVGAHLETPLHWAASCDDVEALDALLDCGAEIEANGGVIGGGTPLTNSTAFGQWKAARRLVTRGATPSLWDAAALGLLDRVKDCFLENKRPDSAKVTAAFWAACHGGQLATAEYLLQQGADLHWVGYDGLTPLEAAVRSKAASLVSWLKHLGAGSASRLA